MFVGNQRDALSEEVLKLLKITHIINVTKHVNNKFEEKGVKYLNIDIEDTSEYQISKYFQLAFHFIDDALSQENYNNLYSEPPCEDFSEDSFVLDEWESTLNSSHDLSSKDKIIQTVSRKVFCSPKSRARVLIHCSMGVSRSPAIAIMYVMKKFRLPFEDSYSLMSLHREKCAPIESFLDELRQFEQNDYEFDKDSIN